jgi:ribosomal protein S18 acetylase RimI-like enzyme
MSIVDINYNDDNHNKIIMKLCKRNKFYEFEVYANIYKDVPIMMKEKLILFDRDYYNIFMKKLKIKVEGINLYGFFVIDRQESRKNAVVGFIIYSLKYSETFETLTSGLEFILIDKKYQNKGFGNILLKKYLNEIDNLEITAKVQVKKNNILAKKWYEKNNFISLSFLEKSLSEEDNNSEYMYYNFMKNVVNIINKKLVDIKK